MRNYKTYIFTCSTIMAFAVLLVASPMSFATKDINWHFNGTVIEACS